MLKQYWQDPPNEYDDGTKTIISSWNNESGNILLLCWGMLPEYWPKVLNCCKSKLVGLSIRV